MALNLESGSYGLRQVNNKNKTVLLMKLTDSALRIFESYQENSNNLRSKPSIQFQGNHGVIKIPVSGGDGESMQKFSFQVSNLPSSAGVDCLHQTRTRSKDHVECIGSINQKITVNATDDSYDMTRQRMTLAKQEEAKTSTKVIKQPGANRGKVFKTGKSRVIEKSHLPSKGKPSPDTRAPTPPISRLTPTIMNRSSSPLTLPNKDRSISPPVLGLGRNKTKPTITLSSSLTQKGGTSPNGLTGAAAVAARPLWDRVSYLLALRPYKLPEITLRLQRDKAAEKSRLLEILSQVASTRNSSGGGTEYCLLRNIYNQLDPESWPGYTENDKKTVKKKMAEMNGTSENRKRTYAKSLSPPDVNSEHSVEEQYSNPTSKKQRVSHLKGRTSGGSSPLEVDKARSPANGGISFGTTQLPPPTSKTHSNIYSKKDTKSPEKYKNFVKESPKRPEKRSPPAPPVKKAEKRPSPPATANGTQDLPEDEDFLKKYTRISSDEQRDRYKKDFYAEYEEYLGHHSNVAAVSHKFAELQRKLNKHEKGSDEYKAISKLVIQEYKKTKKNDAFHREKARWQFLHRKLRHIKELVSAFDQHKLSNNRPETESGFSMQTKTATRVA